MVSYTFEIQWPPPFSQGWQRSGIRTVTIQEAANKLAEFLAVSAENDCILEGRLVRLNSEDDRNK